MTYFGEPLYGLLCARITRDANAREGALDLGKALVGARRRQRRSSKAESGGGSAQCRTRAGKAGVDPVRLRRKTLEIVCGRRQTRA